MEDKDEVVDAYLNWSYNDVVICGCTFTPAQIVRALDGPLYRTLSGELNDEQED